MLSRLFYVVITFLALGIKIPFSSHNQQAKQTRQSLERLGGLFVKLGQHLSLRPDVLSAPYRKELSPLLERVVTVPWDAMHQVFIESHGVSVVEYFDECITTAHASASFAQTYRACKGGQEVLVKIKKPHIAQQVQVDLRILSLLAGTIDRFTQSKFQVRHIVDELREWTHQELDYRQELTWQEEFENISTQTVFLRYMYHEYTENGLLKMFW